MRASVDVVITLVYETGVDVPAEIDDVDVMRLMGLTTYLNFFFCLNKNSCFDLLRLEENSEIF